MMQHAFRPSECRPDAVIEEFRTARTEFILPAALKELARKAATDRGTCLNEMVIRCLEAGLKNEELLEQLRDATHARRMRRRMHRLMKIEESMKKAP